VIGLDALYLLTGALFAAFALQHALARSWRSAVFWGCFAATMLGGSVFSDTVNGALVIVLAVLGAAGLRPKPVKTTDLETRQRSAARSGNLLFLPALAVPAITLAGTLLLPGSRFVDAKQVTLVSLALASVVSLVLAMGIVRAGPYAALSEGRRLVDSIGWAAVLPQLLAALGGIFAAAGVGQVIAHLTTAYIPMTLPVVAVVAYTIGMALFTFVMGNAFAAFPVMTAGIGLPLIVGKFGGDPVVMAAVGMLSGFCGTLMTPMAANFNIVPAAVLDLKDRNGVIKVQIPTALLLLAANTTIMAIFVYHR